MRTLILITGAALLAAAPAFAHEYTIGNIVIDDPIVRATPANAPVSAGYMTIRNTGDEADTLISGSVGFAGKTELHEMSMDNDVMQMRALNGGIEIPAGGEITLMPGGLHMMFMNMQEQMKEGEQHTATLTFENAGSIDVIFNVETLGTIRETMKAKDMEMDHSGHMNHAENDAMKSK